MQPRLDYKKTSPDVYQAMLALEAAVNASGLEAGLLDLIRLRASQLNGCAFCIDLHWKDLRSRGESEQRLYSLDAWRETPFYSPREQAALAWTEAVTLITDGHLRDEVYAAVRQHFTEPEWVQLTLAVVAINGWNRFNISFRTVPGQVSPAPPHSIAVAGG